MNLRDFIERQRKGKELTVIKKEVDPYLEAARMLAEHDGQTVLFEKVKGSDYRMVGGVCGRRKNFLSAFNLKKEEELMRYIAKGIDNPKNPEKTSKPACQEVVEKEVDLTRMPILTHSSKELGPYITAGVFIAQDPEYGTNMSYHRSCRIGKKRLVSRICQRDLHKFLERSGGELDVAICIGLGIPLLLSAAVSAQTGVSELSIANSLSPDPIKVAKCRTNDIYVPADAEIVLEGRMTKERAAEGPFIDITGTYDIVRKEPVIEIGCVTHRKDPIYQALVPSLSEHMLLMGMPREPVVYREVNKVCRCLDVALTKGGCSWFHAAVKIDKKDPEDGKKAIDAAFRGHASLKHVVVVDSDIDIHNPGEVEWSIATRAQAGKDMVVKKEKGSSLDASAEDDRTTYKAGIDATIPSWKPKEKFLKGRLGE